MQQLDDQKMGQKSVKIYQKIIKKTKKLTFSQKTQVYIQTHLPHYSPSLFTPKTTHKHNDLAITSPYPYHISHL